MKNEIEEPNLVAALEQTRQRLEAVKGEFKEAAAKLAVVNVHIKVATERYSALSQVNAQLELVNNTLEVATAKLTAITEQIVVAQNEAVRLKGAREELIAVNTELAVSSAKLAAVNKELKEAIEHVANLQEAKKHLADVNRSVTKANRDLSALNRALKNAHDLAQVEAKLKSEFLANISHEIRTPMSGMVGMCEMLLLNDLDADSRAMAEDIFQSAKRLHVIVNQLLDFSKLESGKMEPERVTFSLAAVVDRVVAVIHPDALKKGLAIKISLGTKIPAAVVGDEGRVEQILLNLVHNAVKFTPSGEINIEADVENETKLRLVARISVADTGIGISADAQKLLFEPFVQADGSTTRRFGGTGLGLSIAKRLVKMLAGEIGVSSIEGKGSTFWFSVPLERV